MPSFSSTWLLFDLAQAALITYVVNLCAECVPVLLVYEICNGATEYVRDTRRVSP